MPTSCSGLGMPPASRADLMFRSQHASYITCRPHTPVSACLLRHVQTSCSGLDMPPASHVDLMLWSRHVSCIMCWPHTTVSACPSHHVLISCSGLSMPHVSCADLMLRSQHASHISCRHHVGTLTFAWRSHFNLSTCFHPKRWSSHVIWRSQNCLFRENRRIFPKRIKN